MSSTNLDGAETQPLWKSGIILTAAAVLSGVGNYLFQVVMGRFLSIYEFGLLSSGLSLVALCAFPLQAVSLSRYRAEEELTKLKIAVLNSKNIIFIFSVSLIAISLVFLKPLSVFFGFPRSSIILAVAIAAIGSLWSIYASAIANGFLWFPFLALVTILGVIGRFIFGLGTVPFMPAAEWAIAATTEAIA